MTDNRREEINNIIKRILKCKDAVYITEIYTPSACMIGEKFKDWVNLMICVTPDFNNTDLYDLLNDIDDEERPFTVSVSVEPDMAERGTGIVLWKK